MSSKAKTANTQRVSTDIPKRKGATVVRRKMAKKGSFIPSTFGLPPITAKPIDTSHVIGETSYLTAFHNINQAWTELYRDYLHYCKISKKNSRKINPDDKLQSLVSISRHITSIIKKENARATVNIEFNAQKQRYEYLIYHVYSFHQEIFVLPLEYLHFLLQSKSVLYDAMVAFYHHLIYRIGFTTWEDNMHLNYDIEMGMQYADDLAEDEPEKALEYIIDSQRYAKEPSHVPESGFATMYLEAVRADQTALDSIFKQAVKRLKVQPHEEPMKRWLLIGIDLLNDKSCCDITELQFRIDPDDNDETSDYMDMDGVPLDRAFIVMWSPDDHVFETYLESVNMDAGEYGSYEPTEWYIISTANNKPYKHSTWPDKFKKWADYGLGNMLKYCENQRIILKNNERSDKAAAGDL
jgi:hypothetical protein